MIHASSVATYRRRSRTAPVQVEHDIGHSLARPVISEFPAPPGAEHGKALGQHEVDVAGAGAGGVKRRVLEQPHLLGRLAGSDVGGARLHRGDGLRVGDKALADRPSHSVAAARGRGRGYCEQIAVQSHRGFRRQFSGQHINTT